MSEIEIKLEYPQAPDLPAQLEVTNLFSSIDMGSIYPGSINTGNINTANEMTGCVEITNLVDGMSFIYPVVVKIEREDDYFIASCPTFGLFITGDTHKEALQAIKELLVDDYNSFLRNYPDKLTKSAKKLLNLYFAFFGESAPA